MNKYRLEKLGLRVPGVYEPLNTGEKFTIRGHDFRYDPNTEIGRRLYSTRTWPGGWSSSGRRSPWWTA